MLTARDITLCRVAMIMRLDKLKADGHTGLYDEHIALLRKLWDMRRLLPKDNIEQYRELFSDHPEAQT